MLTGAEVTQILAGITCAGIDRDDTPAGKMRRDWLEARAEVERLKAGIGQMIDTLQGVYDHWVAPEEHCAALESLRERCARIAARFGDYEWRHVWGAETDIRKAPELISAAILRAPLELNEDGLPVPLEDPKP